MITGRWGKPSEVLLDLVVEEDGAVRGVANPGSNPTLGFYGRMGGERLLDDRGQFGGAYGWRNVRTLIKR